jgi:RecB family exonuclease
VVAARRSDRLTRFDGNLAAVASEVGRPPRASASRLQQWAKCPHAYFMHYLLGVDPVEEPGRTYEISAIDKGSLVHEILDTFVGDALEQGHPLDRWGPADRAALHLIAEDAFARYEAEGRTGRALFWRRDRAQILADLDRFLDVDSGRMAQGLRPLRTELPFDGVLLPLPSGHGLVVHGAIDRVDRRPDGSLEVLDYKTGKSSYYRINEANPHDGGKLLQLFLYAVAAEAEFQTGVPVHPSYWFPTARGEFKQLGYDVTPELGAEVAGAIDLIVEGIAAGIFPAYPAEPTGWTFGPQCDYCSPDGGSTADRYREWEHKRNDPAVAGFLALVEPEVPDAG